MIQGNEKVLSKICVKVFQLCDTIITVWVCAFLGECVPLGLMMINSVARLCPLLQPVSLFSLPNAPSLADLDWEENNTESGKPHLSDHVGSTQQLQHVKFEVFLCAQLCRKQAND